MKREYFKNEKHEGVCIRFVPRYLLTEHEIKNIDPNRHRLYGHSICVEPVLYEREAIEHIMNTIKRLVDIWGEVEGKDFRTNAIPFLRMSLKDLRCRCKEERYRWESEYRIVLHVPKKISEGYTGINLVKVGGGALLNVSKVALKGIRPNMLDDEKLEELRKILIDNDYRDLITENPTGL